ncbi:MAG: ABC transporter permease [Chloroflexota bacterium]
MTTLQKRAEQAQQHPVLRWLLNPESGVLIGIVALVVFFSLQSEFFFDVDNFLNIARQMTMLMIVSFGMTFVILSGEIDLSVGTVLALIGIFVASTLRRDLPIPVALAVGIGSGALIGFISGFITVKGNVPSFIVTLGIFSVARGAAIWLTNSRAIAIFNDNYFAIFADAEPLGIPVSLWYMVAIYLILIFILRYTRFGTSVYAVGGNRNAAELSGIYTDRVKIGVFVLMGVMVGVAAILQTARLGTGFVEPPRNLELDAIAAVVLGGTAFTGGRGSLSKTVLGVVLIAVLNNGLTLLNVQSYYQLIIKGGIIVLALLLDQWLNRGD